ncbi:hypothetical protein [Yoonia sp. BS5-3]|uniref:Uncharacterized protein n=1 Tax=Yoonia phaeophyticola TaxID=3137369 RepID=A0ABZ2V5Z5_9RHOB
MKFLLTLLLGAVLGAAGTLYYIYENHADATEQALMRDTLTTYAPFLEEYITP